VKESPFYLLYGHDPQLPTILEVDTISHKLIAIRGSCLLSWELAKNANRRAQNSQKIQYDCRTKSSQFSVGGRVFAYMPAAKACKAYKFARLFYDPYHIIEQSNIGIATSSTSG